MDDQRKFLLHYMRDFMDEFDLTSCPNPSRLTIDNGINIEKVTSHDHNAINASKIVNYVSTKNNMTLKVLDDTPIKTERFDDWNEQKKYNRYRRVSDRRDNREQRGRSRSRERLKSRIRQRSRSRDRRGRLKSRLRQRSRSRNRRERSERRFRPRSRSSGRRRRSKSRDCYRSESRDRYRSKSHDRRGRSKSIDKYYGRSVRSDRPAYNGSDRIAHDYIDKHGSSSRENFNNSSIDRDVLREYDGSSDRSDSRVNKHENKHTRIDAHLTQSINYRDPYGVAEVMNFDTGSDNAFQLKNWLHKHKYNKSSSTVTSSEFQVSAAHFNDASHEFNKTAEAAEPFKYQGMHSQNQIEERTNPNNFQTRFRSNLFAADVPYQNYTRDFSDYSSSITNRIPNKEPICTVTTGNYSRAASENQQLNKGGVYDSAELQYELSANIDQRPNKTTTICNNKSKKPSPTEIQGSIIQASPSVLPNDPTIVKKREDVESIFKTLISPSSVVAFINLCGKMLDAGKSNEIIQPPTTQTSTADTSEQNDINFMTTTNAEKIVKVKKSKPKRMSSWLRQKSKRNSRGTKADSQNEANSPSTNKNIKQEANLKDDITKSILRKPDTKTKLKAEVVKPKQPYKHTSSIAYSVRARRCQKTAVSYAEQEVDDASEPESPKKLRKVHKSKKRMEPTLVANHSPPKRVKRARMTKRRAVKPSHLDESSSSTAGMRTNQNRKIGAANTKYSDEHDTLSAIANRRGLSANRKRISSELVPDIDAATTCLGLHTDDDKNQQQFTRADDVIPKTESSTIKNNNPQWHCMNQRFECLHCDKNTGISLANHYVNKHRDCEIFPCRLSPDIAEFLRNTTEEHKCERRNDTYEYRQRCYFCDKFKLYTKNLWLQHISVHTGCYEFQCKYCLSTFSALKKDHNCIGKNNCVRKFKYPPFHRRDGIVYGYVCDLCNFVRFKQSEIEKHLRCEHELSGGEGKFRKLVLLTFPKKKKKHEIKAEEKALKLANAIKAATDEAIVILTDDDYEIDQKTPKKEPDINMTSTIEENMPILIIDSDDSDCDDDWITCTGDDETIDNISTNKQPSTSTKVDYVEILPEVISLIDKESDNQTTESLCEMSQQRNDVVASAIELTIEVPDTNTEERNSLIAFAIDPATATAYKKIVIEATTQAENEISDIIATNLSSINGSSFTLNATSNPEADNKKCMTESLNDSISSNTDDSVDMNEFNFGTYVQTDSYPVTTVQQSNIQSSEIPMPPSKFVEMDFLKKSCVTSLVQQSSSSPTPNKFELTDIAGISNQIFTNEEFIEVMEELVGSTNSDATFSNILENYDFEMLCDQELTSTEKAKTSMMQEIVQLLDKTSKVTTTPTSWTTMQLEIDNAANNLVKGTGLAGSDLYRCSLSDCDEKYADKFALKMHLLSHDQSHTNLKCYHCPITCETIDSLLHHIDTHGIHRYFCWYCIQSNPTLENVWLHMREAHYQDNINAIPLNRNKTDDTNDLFVVFPTELEEDELVNFGSNLIKRNEYKLLS